MKQHQLEQGSAAWHAHRAQHFNASDAPAMLGCSPYQSRTQLLHALHTGLRPDVDAATQRRFDDGHRTEALARPLGEVVIGDDLYPVVGTADVDGLPLSASFDGLTMAEDTNWECKRLNDDLRAALPNSGPASAEKNDATRLPKMYAVQMEQQCSVSGATRVLFTAAEFDGAGQVVDERHCWYTPDPALRIEILAGWRQFKADLDAYVPPAAAPVEKIIAEPVESFPAPVVQVSGQIALKDNFKVFEERLRHFLEHRLIRQPKTDDDFVNLDAQIKAMKQAREALKSAEAQMLAQVQPVDQAKRTKDMLDKLLQQNVSLAEGLLKDEKERRKGEIVTGGQKALQAHIDALHARLGRPYLPAIPADFAGAVRGLKSLASMEDKVATELARAKIAANDVADKIDTNLKALRDLAGEFKFLFNDAAALVLKAPDDCRAVITARIAEHKAEQERRAAELAEKERDRIRAEEAARADREAQERAAAERRQREEQEAAARAATPAPTSAPLTAWCCEKGQKLGQQVCPECEEESASYMAATAPTSSPPANVVPMQRTATTQAAPKAPATVSITALNEALGLNVTAGLLEKVGFPAATIQGKAGKFYSPDQLPDICRALSTYLLQRAQFFQQQQAA